MAATTGIDSGRATVMTHSVNYQFGPFCFSTKGHVLLRGTVDLGLPPKAADTLLVLLANAGQVVEKDELFKSVWTGMVVGEGSLTRTISILRKALGRAATGNPYIATVSKRGYRFAAAVDKTLTKIEVAAGSRVMLAVLPFDNLNSSPADDYFSDGLTEEMISQLSRLNPSRLGIIARSSSMIFKGARKRVAQIGRELGVDYVLEGSVRRSRGHIRIAAQLIQTSDETHIWAENYDRRAGDILRLQCQVAEVIAQEIQVKLTPQTVRRLASTPEVSESAYLAYLKARQLFNQRTEDGMRDSIAQYERVIRHSPTYARAYAGIADAYVMLACRGMVPAKETFRRARTAARRAIELDGDLGDAHASLAHVRLHDWDWEGLDRDFQRATELNPSLAIAHYWHAEYLMCQGKCDEAIAMGETAHRLDPLSPVIGSSMAMILYLARRYDRAEAVLTRTLQRSPRHFLPHLRLGLVRVQQNKHEHAISEFKLAIGLAGHSTETLAALGMAYAAQGDTRRAQRIVTQLERLRGKRYVLPYNIAKIYAAARDKKRAFEWLETAYEGANPDLIELNSEPIFDPIRRTPRFTGLMRRIGWEV
jgi:TolB-like protein/Flp pilus assembly protein TadD